MYVFLLLGFVSFSGRVPAAAANDHAISQDASGETVPAEGMEVDDAPGGDDEDHSHAIMVWSIILGCIAGGLSIVGLVLWLVGRSNPEEIRDLMAQAYTFANAFQRKPGVEVNDKA